MDEAEQLKIQNERQAALIISYAELTNNFLKWGESQLDVILELEGKVGEMEDEIRKLLGGSGD